MAFTQSDLDTIDRAIAAGELEVEVDGQRTRYRSMSELVAARALISNVLAVSSQGAAGRSVFSFTPTTSRE